MLSVANKSFKMKTIYLKELSEIVIGLAIEVHRNLGNGFLEKVYENALIYELGINGISFENQKPLSVYYKEHIVGEYYADIIVENSMILELKTVRRLNPIHEAQLINYLKATGNKVGYLLNFGSPGKLEFKRFVY